MGERAGYRVKDKKNESWICRRQWYVGGSKEQLEAFVYAVAHHLLNTSITQISKDKVLINSGIVALRDDLCIGRLFGAVANTVCTDGFNSLEPTIKCDIDDHGLFEIELLKWNEWAINHYETHKQIGKPTKKAPFGKFQYGVLQKKKRLGVVKFEAGKELKDGIRFEWSEDFEEY